MSLSRRRRLGGYWKLSRSGSAHTGASVLGLAGFVVIVQPMQQLSCGRFRRSRVLPRNQIAIRHRVRLPIGLLEYLPPLFLSMSSTRKCTTRVRPMAASGIGKPGDGFASDERPAICSPGVAQRPRPMADQRDGPPGEKYGFDQCNGMRVVGEVP